MRQDPGSGRQLCQEALRPPDGREGLRPSEGPEAGSQHHGQRPGECLGCYLGSLIGWAPETIMGFKEWAFPLLEAGHSLVSDGAWGSASLGDLLIRSVTPTPQVLGPGGQDLRRFWLSPRLLFLVVGWGYGLSLPGHGTEAGSSKGRFPFLGLPRR